MEQVLFGGRTLFMDPLHNISNRYNSLVGGDWWNPAEVDMVKLVSTDGKMKNLRVKLDDSPGVGKKYTFSLMLNGVRSALTLDIAGNDTSGADTTHEIDVKGGDAISLECDPDNTPTERYAAWTSMFEGDTAKESLILGGTATVLDETAISYNQVMGASSTPSPTENNFRQIIPTAGTIKNFYVKLTVDPGTAPEAYIFTLRKGGLSQALTVTIIADNTTGNDLVNSFAVAAGDVLTMMIEPVATPSFSPMAAWGMTFVADTDGESIVLSGTFDDLNPAATEYTPLQCNDDDVWGSETDCYELGQVCTLKKLYMLLSAAPGDGKSYTFTVRINGADGNLTVTITGAATTGNDVAHTDAISNDDYVDLECVPSPVEPNVADAYWGVVGYIAPPVVGWTGKISGVTDPAKVMGVAVADIAEVKGVA